MQQEELARLFSANLTFSHQNLPPPSSEHDVPLKEPVQAQQGLRQPEVALPITYISQHYTHSHHVVPVRLDSLQLERTHIEASALASILLRNSIDPSLLFPSQIDLFQNADDDQRLRLLELWRISPPRGRQGYPQGMDYNASRQLYDGPPTSLAQEEAMAKLRYERTLEQAQSEGNHTHQQEPDQSMYKELQSGVMLATCAVLASSPDAPAAEPYIVSGYDMLAKRDYEESARAAVNHLTESTKYNRATDPVYNSSGANGGKNDGSALDMENRYGAFAQARDYATQPMYADDEMVM